MLEHYLVSRIKLEKQGEFEDENAGKLVLRLTLAVIQPLMEQSEAAYIYISQRRPAAARQYSQYSLHS